MVRGWTMAAALIVTLTVLGCKKPKPTEEEGGENPLKYKPGGAAAEGAVRRGAARQVNQNLLRSVMQYYQLYQTENGKPPKDLATFKAYVQSDPNARQVYQALDEGWLVMTLPPHPPSAQLLAYEKEPFKAFNNRLILFRDGAVKLVYEPEFQEALKGK
jgi:hypothetical protein